MSESPCETRHKLGHYAFINFVSPQVFEKQMSYKNNYFEIQN